MKLNKRTKIVGGALAFAGALSLAGGAFTATGVTNSADVDPFIGGQVSQDVHGATLLNVAYKFSDAPVNTVTSEITLSFDIADTNVVGQKVSVSEDGGTTPIACDVAGIDIAGDIVCTAAFTDLDKLTVVVASNPADIVY